MKIIVSNLKRRPDKKGATRAGLLIFKHIDESEDVFFTAHDNLDYTDTKSVATAMKKADWCFADGWQHVPKAQLAFVWTYIDMLKLACATPEPTLILLDDQYIPYAPEAVEHLAHKLRPGECLAINLKGRPYRDAEDAMLYSPEGAALAMRSILGAPDRKIHETLQNTFGHLLWVPTSPFALNIGKKGTWKSDIHGTETRHLHPQ